MLGLHWHGWSLLSSRCLRRNGMSAMCTCRCAALRQAPPPLPYLLEADRHTFDICLEAALLPAGASHALTVTRSNFKHLWVALLANLLLFLGLSGPCKLSKPLESEASALSAQDGYNS